MEKRIGSLEELRSRSIQRISIGQREFVLIYYQQNFYALNNACPHKFASLCTGNLRGDRIVCPWHGAEFNIVDGKSFSPLTPKGTNSYPVIIRDHAVFIDLAEH